MQPSVDVTDDFLNQSDKYEESALDLCRAYSILMSGKFPLT